MDDRACHFEGAGATEKSAETNVAETCQKAVTVSIAKIAIFRYLRLFLQIEDNNVACHFEGAEATEKSAETDAADPYACCRRLGMTKRRGAQ